MTDPSTSVRKDSSSGFSPYFVLKFTLLWLQRLLMTGLLRLIGRRPKFVVLTPPFLKKQIVLDVKMRTVLSLQIRDVVDLCTLNEIYWDIAYDLSRLRRSPEIAAWYQKLLETKRQPLIVDCGANVGLAARYFAHDYPGAKIIAIEPDEANVRQARMNNNASRVAVVQAAVGSTAMRGRIIDLGLGNNALRVEADAGGALEIVSLNSILAGAEREGMAPFIVKIDIEGYEHELFSQNIEWLDRFPVLVIELHDWLMPGKATARNFLRAIAALDRDFVYINENVFSISNRSPI